MADHSAIEWTEASWNPILGCTTVSPGCDHCYAAREASGRLRHQPLYAGLAEGGKFTGEVRLVEARLTQPLRWRRPRRVFVNSMSDLFHDGVPDEFIAWVFVVMSMARQHTFQVLTKRHGRMRSLLGSDEFQVLAGRAAFDLIQSEKRTVGWEWPLPNVWLGVSVEDQHWANIRIPALLDTPAAVHWLSCEPLLGHISLAHRWLQPDLFHPDATCIDWVVTGGESGPFARPMHPDWARALRDQCAAAGTPYFHKQWGEWAPIGPQYSEDDDGEAASQAIAEAAGIEAIEGKRVVALESTGHIAEGHQPTDPRTWLMARLGKHAAGRHLDGKLHDAYPTSRTPEAVA